MILHVVSTIIHAIHWEKMDDIENKPNQNDTHKLHQK